MSSGGVHGLGNVLRNLKAAEEHVRKGAAEGLFISSEDLLKESRDLVPWETGDLERSGFADVDAEALEAAVSYDEPHAIAQHEQVEWEHDDGRQAKYLEAPFMRDRNKYAEIIAGEVRKAIEEG